ncbi:DUF421 domain-containing protein [Geosporobacter ferrireducens]|uniref:YetF C-terminal domain-containing protein n=1 Tax=Geosporobacter ferrireducens TaxID=1424294 RepID=A0A1D8GI00_9FIRM|nr:DUF421 domain-containing protein [Geosporobacter ferrireducens]AOT70536.1 hypothetical protein Gferi_13715 [Geosporobacter ferrireducens]
MAYVLKILIIYILILIIFRIIGKRVLSQLTNFDMAVLLILGMIAAGPLMTQNIMITFYGIILLTLLHLLMISISRNQRIRDMIFGTPKVLIQRGKISEDSLRAAKLSMLDLMNELRQQGYCNVADVEFAIMEDTGKVTVMPKADKRPLQAADVGLAVKPVEIPLPVIIEGRILEENLKYRGLDISWLALALKAYGVAGAEEVSLATVNSQGVIHVDKYDKK